MKNKYLFKSERLGFRVLEEADSELFFEMNSDPEVMRYFPKVRTKEESDEFIRRAKAEYALSGFSFFAADLLASNTLIGFIGLWQTKFESHFTPCVEIGWRLRKQFWNKGLATEGAKRCLDFAWAMDIPEVYSFTSWNNAPSERVMIKAGLIKKEEFMIPVLSDDHPLNPHLLYWVKNPGR